MAVFKIKGVVLKEISTGEASKQIIVLAKEHGKMLLSARGAKNNKSKLLPCTQAFCFAEFTVFYGKGFYSISDAELIDSFYGIRNDLEKLAYASYILETAEKTVFQGLEADDILRLIVKSFHVLEKENSAPMLIASVFCFKMLQINGFMPELDRCCVCDGDFSSGIYYSFLENGFLCHSCRAAQDVFLEPGVAKAVAFVFSAPISGVFAFRASEKVQDGLWRFAVLIMSDCFDDEFKTLKFITDIKKSII